MAPTSTTCPEATQIGAATEDPDGSNMQLPPQDRFMQIELPLEIKQGFRRKALILASMQSWIVLAMAIAFDRSFKVNKAVALFSMLGCLLLAAALLLVFWCYRHRYPLNYMMLLVTTLMAGTFWSFTENSIFLDHVNMPQQVCIIMTCMITIWLVTILIPVKTYDTEAMFVGLFVGWLIGAGVNVYVSLQTDLDMRSCVPATVAVFVSTVVILIGVAKPMMRCCADDYMIVCLALTANLFLLVSVPVVLFLVSLGGSGCSCEAGTDDQAEEPQQPPPQPATQAPPPAPTVPSEAPTEI